MAFCMFTRGYQLDSHSNPSIFPSLLAAPRPSDYIAIRQSLQGEVGHNQKQGNSKPQSDCTYIYNISHIQIHDHPWEVVIHVVHELWGPKSVPTHKPLTKKCWYWEIVYVHSSEAAVGVSPMTYRFFWRNAAMALSCHVPCATRLPCW